MLAYNFYTQKTWTPLLLDQKNQGGPEPLQWGPWPPPQMVPLSQLLVASEHTLRHRNTALLKLASQEVPHI